MPGSLAKVRQHLLLSGTPSGTTGQGASLSPSPSSFLRSSSSYPLLAHPSSLTPASDPTLPIPFFTSARLRKISPPALPSTTAASHTFRADTNPSSQKQHSPLVSISQLPPALTADATGDRIGPSEGKIDDVRMDVEEVEAGLAVSCELPKFCLCNLTLVLNGEKTVCIVVDRWELDPHSPTFAFWDGSRFNDEDLKLLIRRTDLPVLFQRKSAEQLKAPVRITRRVALDLRENADVDVLRSSAHFNGSVLRIVLPHT